MAQKHELDPPHKLEPGLRDAKQFDELVRQSQRHLLAFIDAELRLAFTFADFAVTERDLGNIEHFHHARQDAAKAAETVRRFAERIENSDARIAALGRCAEVERAVAAL